MPRSQQTVANTPAWELGMANFSTYNTAVAVTDFDPTTTRPATSTSASALARAVIDMEFATGLQVKFIGTDAADEQFNTYIVGWRHISGTDLTTLWEPTPLFSFEVTLSSITGVASTPVLNTHYVADGIGTVTDYTGGNILYKTVDYSGTTANAIGAMFWIPDAASFKLIELRGTRNGSAPAAASFNWLTAKTSG